MIKEEQLANLFAVTGHQFVLDLFAPGEDAAQFYIARLEGGRKELERRFGSSPDLPTIQVLCEMEHNAPDQLRAFIQCLARTATPSMLALAWRLVHQSSVASIDLHLSEDRGFELTITAKHPGSNTLEVYKSQDVKDKAILEQICFNDSGDGPRYVGFFGRSDFSDSRRAAPVS